MKYYNNKVIIGIDHGYGNTKTTNHIFKTGVAVSDTEPVFGTNVLFYNLQTRRNRRKAVSPLDEGI